MASCIPSVLVCCDDSKPSETSMLGLMMRYEKGGSLFDLLHTNRPWTAAMRERLRLMLEIAEGLWHLHHNINPIG